MIYEIDQALDELLTLSEGEITAEIDALLADREKAYKWLCGATRAYLNESARLEGLKAEYTRLNQLKADTNEKIERLKKTIGRLLGEGNKEDLGFSLLGWRKSEAVEIEPGAESTLEDDYVVTTFTPDKNKIKADLKAGKTISGCTLVTRQNLQIK